MNNLISLKYYNQQGGIIGKGFGIQNVGNTCWLNAYTQLIIHSKKYIDKLKYIKSINPSSTEKEILLNKIIDFTVSLHNQVINKKNTINTLDNTTIRKYAGDLSNFIGNCQIGQIYDSDERLGEFQQKIIKVLDLDFNKDGEGNPINTTESIILDRKNIDSYIISGKSKMKSFINKKNPFETSLFIDKNIYESNCKTLTQDGSEIEIAGKIKFTFAQGWLTPDDLDLTNINLKKKFTEQLKNQLTPTLDTQMVDKFRCGGISKQTKVYVTFTDGTFKQFEIIGDPGSQTNFEINDNKLFYSQSGKGFDHADFFPDNGLGNRSPESNWVFITECFDYTEENGAKIQEHIVDKMVKGEPYLNGERHQFFDLQIDDNMPNLLCLKIKRPGQYLTDNNYVKGDWKDYSVDYKFDEIMSIQDSKGKNNDYLLIGGTVNVGLGGGHYTAFVRRNDKYYYHDDSKEPTTININNSTKDLGRTTTFIIYEKIDTLKEIIMNCNQ